MARTVSLTDRIFIPDPCPAAWDAMTGDDRARYCAHCGKTVHNISAMSEAQAHALLDAADAHLCVNFLRDRKGRPITADRPLSLATARSRRALAKALGGLGRLAACIGLGSLILRCLSGCAANVCQTGSIRTGGRVAPAGSPIDDGGDSSNITEPVSATAAPGPQ